MDNNEDVKRLILDLGVSLRGEMRELREEMRDGFTQVNERIDRQVGGLRDELSPKLDLLAEGILHMNEKIDREAADIRGEMRDGFAETHNLIRLAYKDLAKP